MRTPSTSTAWRSSGKIDPLIGRAHELERVIQVLCRRRKNNPLLVGEAGVGKTAIAEGLARRINEGEVPELLKEYQVYLARHGRAARRHEIPRRLRAAPEGGAEAARRKPEVDPLHRRDPHDHRRGRGLRRHARRVQPAEAGAVDRRAEVHRRDDVRRVPPDLREGPRAVAPLPEGRRAGAVDRRDDRDPQGPQDALRAASRREVRAGGAHRGGGARRALHQRPSSARQGDRRDRRSGRRAEDPAEVAAEEGHRQERSRGDRREDRAHPGEERVVRRPQRAEDARPRPEERRLRPGQGDRRAGRRPSAWRARASATRASRSATSCSAARPASARPRSRGSSRSASASSSSASTCPSTWSGTRCRA